LKSSANPHENAEHLLNIFTGLDYYLCCGLCSDGTLPEEYWNIPESDLWITWSYAPDTVFLWTKAQSEPYKKETMLISHNEEVLSTVDPKDRIIVSDIRIGTDAFETSFKRLKALFRGIKEHEARDLLGTDTVSLDAFEAQGITTSEQLRAKKAEREKVTQ
jgi:hypothetical protein